MQAQSNVSLKVTERISRMLVHLHENNLLMCVCATWFGFLSRQPLTVPTCSLMGRPCGRLLLQLLAGAQLKGCKTKA